MFRFVRLSMINNVRLNMNRSATRNRRKFAPQLMRGNARLTMLKSAILYLNVSVILSR